MRTEQKEITTNHISFKPLLKLLIDKDMDTTELCVMAGISPTTMTAIRAHKSVSLDTIVKICIALDCSIESVVEIV